MDEAPDRLAIYDHPEVQKTFVSQHKNGRKEVALSIDNIHCGGCVRRCERSVESMPGVVDFQVNLSTRRAQLIWQPENIQLSAILTALNESGYPAHPYDQQRQEARQKQVRNLALRRLAVAGFGMMQVMMFSVALYAGDFQDMDSATKNFLCWMSLLVALPVVLYSARVFFVNAWQGLRHKQLGMDLPVSMAIGGAFLASCWATVSGEGEVYFDSVTMFTFLLLLGRFLELSARLKAARFSEDLVDLLPPTALRLEGDKQQTVPVPVLELKLGDCVLVKPGAAVPIDGKVLTGTSTVDEALLTGESTPRTKRQGDQLIGGSVNVESPLTVQVEKVGNDTVLAAMTRLLNRAQLEKPHLARLADQIASWFVGVLLLLATAVFLWWWQIDPDNAFWITLSVLVVTCPCALSLATPTALTAASGTLTRLGLLPTRGHALETLAKVNHIVFDKTGTLTQGRPTLEQVQVLRDVSSDECLSIAASLEQYSEHPIAKALGNAAGSILEAKQVSAEPGSGVEGWVQGRRYRIGSVKFSAALSSTVNIPEIHNSGSGMTLVGLGDEQGLLALFKLSDELRPQAKSTIKALQTLGLNVEILSGDSTTAVTRIADKLGISHFSSQLSPQDKLTRLQALQAQGEIVAMVGDGVNDSPVLAQAQVSIAMGSGSEIARSNADMVLLSEQLGDLVQGVVIARHTLNVIRQNLTWALTYNALALPLAAMGFVAPWLAAIGMSFSSLVVVLNALRLSQLPDRQLHSDRQQPSPAQTTLIGDQPA